MLSPYEFALLDYERTLYKIGKGDGGDLNSGKASMEIIVILKRIMPDGKVSIGRMKRWAVQL